MVSNTGNLTSRKFKSIVICVVSFALVLGSVGFVAPQFFSQVAHAANNAITVAATDMTSTDATLKGTNGNYDATGHSFWVSLDTFDTTNLTPRTGLYWTDGIGNVAANTAFSAALSSVKQSSDSTSIVITPNTKYYFVAWSLVGGTWYPGAVLNFTTDPAPAPILTLTVPAAKTITRSALVPETSGTPTGGKTVVDAAINGLNAIPVTLANTGDAASDNVRINPINAGAHIQLWAKDTSNNWFDINVTGWIGSAGKSIPAGSSITTDVYAISDVAGSYPLTVNLVNAVGGTNVTSAAGTVTVAPIIHTQEDFKAFDGVNIGTNSYTVSNDITATYTTGTGTESNPVLLKLTGYAPIVTPWFDQGWGPYNYVTIGIKLPAGFTGTRVYQTGVIRYNVDSNGIYAMGTGSTDLATTGDASGYLDYSFAANSNNTKKDGLVKLQVIWTEGATSEYFTIDVNGLQLAPDVPAATLTANGVNILTNGYTNSNTFTFNLSSADATRYQLKYWNDIVTSRYKEGTPWNSMALGAVYPDSFTQGEGTHYFAFSACNAASNCSAYSTPFIVTYDKTAPAVPGNPSPADQSYVNTHDFTFSWDTVNNLSTPVSYEWEFSYGIAVNDDGSFTNRSGFHSLASASVNSPGTPDNIYYWHVRAIDSAGNKSAWASPWKVTVDNIAPVVVKADLTEYNKAVDAVNEADYTKASWATYQTVVTANVVTTADDQAQVDAAVSNIVAAQGNLVTLVAPLAYEADLLPQPQTAPVTPPNQNQIAANNPQQAMSDNSQNAQAVKGATTKKDNNGSLDKVAALAATDSGWSIFGLMWYWWALIAAAIAAAWWVISAAIRRRGQGLQ